MTTSWKSDGKSAVCGPRPAFEKGFRHQGQWKWSRILLKTRPSAILATLLQGISQSMTPARMKRLRKGDYVKLLYDPRAFGKVVDFRNDGVWISYHERQTQGLTR
jgi:hypothetical protein